MFEDILGRDKPSVPSREEVNINACPYCGSATIEEDSGIFVSNKEFVLTMVCQNCGRMYKVHYNEDLDVIDIEY